MGDARWTLDMGAQVTPAGVRFRVWVPTGTQVDVAEIREREIAYHPMDRKGDGVFGTTVAGSGEGMRYKFRIDGKAVYPDPYSRFQPEGVHGPSEVVDPAGFAWHDGDWTGLTMDGLVVYECHVGAYTQAGTFEALIPELEALHRLGITALELMPVAEFPGRRNWGYDGVDLFAPAASYGGPAGLKRLVDAAHGQGLGVLLDVVYNHLGPDGNYLRAYSTDYFTSRYKTPWGEALNYDGPESSWVRHYVTQNACYWLNEYHVDGLRLDATHAIFDGSTKHILQELAETARASVAPARRVVIIAESATNDVTLIEPVAKGGYGLDAVWADDFHHALRTFLTGERDGYYADYSGQLGDVAKTIREGFLYQGAYSRHLRKARGTPTADRPARQFVFCIQNHDQVGNRALGDRLNQVLDPARYRVASALLMLVPETPLIFMGQEFAASAPFPYFSDHEPGLGRLVTEGRRAEFAAFAAFRDEAPRARIPDPQAASTFQRAKLDFDERVKNQDVYALYRDLLWLRRTDAVFSRQDRFRLRVGADKSLLVLLTWCGREHRLVIGNFGEARALALGSLSLAEAVTRGVWSVLLSTAASPYSQTPGGNDVVEVNADHLVIPGSSAVVLALTHDVPGP